MPSTIILCLIYSLFFCTQKCHRSFILSFTLHFSLYHPFLVPSVRSSISLLILSLPKLSDFFHHILYLPPCPFFLPLSYPPNTPRPFFSQYKFLSCRPPRQATKTADWSYSQMYSANIDCFSPRATDWIPWTKPLFRCAVKWLHCFLQISRTSSGVDLYNSGGGSLLEHVDVILKWGAGCHSNHMMRQAGLFKGIQLLLAFPSASHQSSEKDMNTKT